MINNSHINYQTPIRNIDRINACPGYRVDRYGDLIGVEENINAQTKIAKQSADVANNVPNGWGSIEVTVNN